MPSRRPFAIFVTAMALLSLAVPAAAIQDPAQNAEEDELPIVDGKRVALVIGNSKYLATDGWRVLPNAERDVRYVASQLSAPANGAAAFEVTLLVDQTHAQLTEALEVFSRRAAAADIALVYYAGHGFQFKSDNFIVPVDARASVSERALEFEHINVAKVVNASAARKLSLFFFDACRTTDAIAATSNVNNNVNRATYFGAIEAEESGVIYAAGARSPAYDAAPADSKTSPFAEAVVKHLKREGLELSTFYRWVTRDVKKATKTLNPVQYPLSTARMESRFYFLPRNRRSTPRPNAPEVVVFQDVDGNDVEVLMPDEDVGPQAMPAQTRGGGCCIEARPTLSALEIPLENLIWDDDEILVLEALDQTSDIKLHALGDQGDPLANYILGIMYFEGITVEADWTRAEQYFRQSAAGGNPAGLYGLAWFAEQLIFEYNIEPDADIDLEALYRSAHQGGFLRATIRIAEAYSDRLIAPPADKPNDNVDFWRLAAEQEHYRSMYELVIRDDENAAIYKESLLDSARNQVDIEALTWACMLGDEHLDLQGQLYACINAAGAGEELALQKLTLDLINRENADISREEAQNWARLALQIVDFDIENRARVQNIADGKI